MNKWLVGGAVASVLAPVAIAVYQRVAWVNPGLEAIALLDENQGQLTQLVSNESIPPEDEARLRLFSAIARTVQYAEGTLQGNAYNQDPYCISFSYDQTGYDLCKSLNWADHPRYLVPIFGTDLGSDVSGAYQFLSPTYDGLFALYPDALLTDQGYFSPANQDRAFLLNMGEIGALQILLDGLTWDASGKPYISKEIFLQATYRMAGQWASFQFEDGTGIGSDPALGSQGTIHGDHLYDVFRSFLEE